MATNSINEKTEKPLLLFLYYNDLCTPYDHQLIKDCIDFDKFDSICAPTILEHSIAHISNHLEHTSDHHLDFDDKSDAKFGTTTYYTGKYVRDPKCTISCGGKHGGIRAVVFEPQKSVFYFFCVPRHMYKQTIDIEFQLDGTPKRLSSKTNKINKVWLCEVPDFVVLSNFKF